MNEKQKVSTRGKILKSKRMLLIMFLAIIFTGLTGEIYAQNKVSGTVTDVEGNAIPGASVVVKGTSTGAVTDTNGKFNVAPPSMDATLIFSYIGMETQEVSIRNRSVLNIKLASGNIDLDEVVAIGYGSVKKSNLTTAVSKVEGDRLENRQVSNLSQALAGQLTGVRVQQSSGVPGASAEVFIRGVGSLNGDNQPLYIIDGFPVEDPVIINGLDFSNVEDVQVLKDASSTAIYGARGANGIILVTTKQGTENKTNITLKVNSGVQNVLKRVDYLSGPEFTEHRWHSRQNAWTDQGKDPNAPSSARPGAYRVEDNWLIPDSIPNFDVQDWLFKTGKINDYNITASGGNSKTKFLISGGYFDQVGIVRNSGYSRFNQRTRIDTKINQYISMGTSFYATYAQAKNSDFEGKDGMISALLITQLPISQMLSNSNNEYGSTSNKYADALEYRYDERKQMSFSGNTYVKLMLVKGLEFKTMLGYSLSQDQRDLFDPIQVTKTIPPKGRAWNNVRRKWQIDNTLTYTTTIDKHNFTALIGQSAYKTFYYGASISGEGYPNSLSHTLNNATTYSTDGTYTTENENSMASYFGRINYAYHNKYMMSVSLRRDGSSRFGADSKWGNFPSVSAGWNIMNEGFFSSYTDKINTLKVRASWGRTGNNGIPNYMEYSLLGSANAVFGTSEAIASGLSGINVANPDLRWEQSDMLNLGLDLGFIKNKIQLSVENYVKTTKDLLLDVPISTTTGFNSALLNYGSIENKGWEFDLTTRNINKEFKWSSNFNLSLNSNKVLKLGPDDAPIENGQWYAPVHLTKVGGTIGAFYMYEAIGVFKDQADLDSYPAYNGSKPGDIKIKDQLTVDTDGDGIPDKADGVIDTNDRTVLGSGIPKYFFGFTNTFSYKNFEVSVLISGAGGNKIYNAVSRQSNNGADGQMYGLWRNAWRSPENPGDGMTPRANRNNSGGNRQYTSRWLYDGDFWKVANVTLSYNFSKTLIRKVGLSSAKCFVTADNIYLKDRYPIGHNPEVNESTGNPFRQGDDYNTYPLSKTISIGLELGF